MSKPTPGPWVAPMQNGGIGPTTGIVWAQEPHGGPVATVCRSVENPDVATTANARLIAAAPDMLAALELAQEYTSGDVNERISDAIAKAKGETP